MHAIFLGRDSPHEKSLAAADFFVNWGRLMQTGADWGRLDSGGKSLALFIIRYYFS